MASTPDGQHRRGLSPSIGCRSPCLPNATSPSPITSTFSPHSTRRTVLQRLMRPRLVVVREEPTQPHAQFRHPLVIPQVHIFVLHRPPQTLDKNIVQAPPLAVHAHLHARLLQSTSEGRGRELHALIRVENLRPTASQCLVQHLHAEATIQRVRQPPTGKDVTEAFQRRMRTRAGRPIALTPPVPGFPIELGDSRTNRSVGATIPIAPRTTRSSRGVRTTAENNPQILTLGAGPCTLRVLAAEPKCLSLPQAVRTAWAGESAADNVATVPDGDAGPPRSHARSGSPDGVANAGHPGGKPRCNNDSAAGGTETTARSL
jgi:hypothetical protein